MFDQSALEKQLQQMFQAYLHAFKNYDLAGVVQHYNVPSTLNTPDSIILINNENECQNILSDILTQLKTANIVEIIAKNPSYQVLTQEIVLVCIDWFFLDDTSEVFTDFSAVYHIAQVNSTLKIVNVNSHELSNSLSLTPFNLT